jgi:hypothetical protein
MQINNNELKNEETKNNDSLLLSDSLVNLLKSFDELDFGADNIDESEFLTGSLFGYAYLHTQEKFFKTKFVSLSSLKEKIVLSVICDNQTLESIIEKKINHILIEYSDVYIQKVRLENVYNYTIKHVKDNSYLVEFLI